jgi:type I restriction enzyme M protein
MRSTNPQSQGNIHWIKEKGKWAGDDEGMTGMNFWHCPDEKLFPALRNIDISVETAGH